MPIRIQDAPPAAPQAFGAVESPARESTGTAHAPFARQLTDLSREQYEMRVQDLARAVDEQAAKLLDRMDLAEFQRYRELVGRMLHETVSNSYQYHKEGGFDARGRHRVMAMVQTVNEQLDRLADDFLSDQADNLRVLARIDDIRGLLVDIFL